MLSYILQQPKVRRPGSAININAYSTSEQSSGNHPTIDQDHNVGGQQLQTESGNDTNERGSLVGEAGNKKIQKKQYKWGKLAVSTMSRTLLLAFTTTDAAEEFQAIVEFTYGHTRLQMIGFKTELEGTLKETHTFFWIALKLGFTMAYSSMGHKFGESIRKSKYCMVRSINENLEDLDDGILDQLKKGLQLCFKNKAGFSTFDELLIQEQNRSDWQKNNGAGTSAAVSKKRKLNFD